MDTETYPLNCPVCRNFISVEKEHVVTCKDCGTKLELIRYNEKIVSIRRYIYPPGYYIRNDLSQLIIELVEKNLSPEKWGFSKNSRYPNKNQQGIVIYDSDICRIKFVLESSDYFPQHDTKIYYGRLHAPDDNSIIVWNNQDCRCWHQDIYGLTLPFIEGIDPSYLAANINETWPPLLEKLNINYSPFDLVEYPLRLHSKIWEHYQDKLFSIFDLRNSEIWEKYSHYSNEFDRAFYKRLNMAYDIKAIC